MHGTNFQRKVFRVGGERKSRAIVLPDVICEEVLIHDGLDLTGEFLDIYWNRDKKELVISLAQ